MEWAVFSPLPPSRSGIADYVAEQLPFLCRHSKLRVFVEDAEQLTEKTWEDVSVHAVEEFDSSAALQRLPRLFHIGNNPHHEFVYRRALEHPGVVVLHDYVLHHLITEITLARGDRDSYVEHLKHDHGDLGIELARQRDAGAFSPRQLFMTPLNGRLIHTATDVIVHSKWAQRRIASVCPRTKVSRIPHHFYAGDLASLPPTREAAKRSVGADPKELLIVCVGYITPPKQVDLLIESLAAVADRLPPFRLLLVGEAARPRDLTRQLKRNGLARRTTLTGYAPLSLFQEAILAADIVVNLRYPSAGETSGTLTRAMGLGRCCVIFDYAAFSDVPGETVIKLPLDTKRHHLLSEAIVRLAHDPKERERIGAAARRHVRNTHDQARCARRYADVMSRCASSLAAV